jgi:hypothetical protein
MWGVGWGIKKLFHKHYFVLFSSSLYNSTFKGSNGKQRSTDFNGNYMLNLLSGLEYKVGKSKKNTLLKYVFNYFINNRISFFKIFFYIVY